MEIAARLTQERFRDAVTEALGTWLLLGVFLDGWAHLNLPGPETFFTPWHLALYSGFALLSLWTAAVIYARLRRGASFWNAIPRGYRATVAGVLIFGVGGLLDLFWHEVFGLEIALDALVSPTHVILGAGGVLILSTAVRSARPGQRVSLLAVALTTALVSFFLVYASVFAASAASESFVPTPEGTPGHAEAELPVIAGLDGYVVSTVLITAPLLYVLGSGIRPLAGTVTWIVGSLAWLSVGMVGFPLPAVGGAIGATAAGIVVDLVLWRLSPSGIVRWLPLIAGGTVALVRFGQLTGLALTDAVRWPVAPVAWGRGAQRMSCGRSGDPRQGFRGTLEGPLGRSTPSLIYPPGVY
ncbi:hypothetical protein ACLRGI_07590 [Paenarthrobacter nitroguajacolicus]|uniref:hypothetical protein n=1 Tax=Paenarthrobacter nitroguajacolicus TaxID=211146 RepID=UPI003AEDABF4